MDRGVPGRDRDRYRLMKTVHIWTVRFHETSIKFAKFSKFLVLRIAPKSRGKVCVQWRIFKLPGSLLAKDRSKA